VLRQGTIKGLDLVDFNYPQHLAGLDVDGVKQALADAGLRTGAICMRYPKEFQAGAMTHPDPAMRARAIALTKEGCAWAERLGAKELVVPPPPRTKWTRRVPHPVLIGHAASLSQVVWSAFDGYDYSHQVRAHASRGRARSRGGCVGSS
jgi:sugar phosphate isomerase/epimerase